MVLNSVFVTSRDVSNDRFCPPVITSAIRSSSYGDGTVNRDANMLVNCRDESDIVRLGVFVVVVVVVLPFHVSHSHIALCIPLADRSFTTRFLCHRQRRNLHTKNHISNDSRVSFNSGKVRMALRLFDNMLVKSTSILAKPPRAVSIMNCC